MHPKKGKKYPKMVLCRGEHAVNNCFTEATVRLIARTSALPYPGVFHTVKSVWAPKYWAHIFYWKVCKKTIDQGGKSISIQ